MPSHKTYLLATCSAEVTVASLQLVPLLHSILCCPILKPMRSTSLPSTKTVFDFVKIVGVLLAEVKILGDVLNSLTTSGLQFCFRSSLLFQSVMDDPPFLC